MFDNHGDFRSVGSSAYFEAVLCASEPIPLRLKAVEYKQLMEAAAPPCALEDYAPPAVAANFRLHRPAIADVEAYGGASDDDGGINPPVAP